MLRVTSSLPMDESRPIRGVPDGVARRMDDVPHTLVNGTRYSPIGEIAGGVLLLHAAGIGRYCIYGGKSIDFSVEDKANPFAVERFLWGNALAGLIHQRGELPLHAATVRSADGRQVIAFCGVSGAGKSTMAATFLQHGWEFFSDDLTRITAGERDMLAWPGAAAMRLRADACERLGVSSSKLIRDAEGQEKFLIRVGCTNDPAPLTTIIALGGQEPLPRLQPLAASTALPLVVSNVLGPRKLRAMGRLKEHFLLMQQLLAGCRVYLLHGRRTATPEVLSRVIFESLG
jgi:hypothetical protein